MTDPTPDEPAADEHESDGRDAEDLANDELPLDPAAPTELGNAIDD
jgi:hypothetical protein